MTDRRYGFSTLFRAMGAGVVLALAPGLSSAYVGPGVGLSALGSVLAFIGAIFLLIVGFLWYPIKRLLRRRSRPGTEEAGDAPGENDS
jgi:hypothetical protein